MCYSVLCLQTSGWAKHVARGPCQGELNTAGVIVHRDNECIDSLEREECVCSLERTNMAVLGSAWFVRFIFAVVMMDGQDACFLEGLGCPAKQSTRATSPRGLGDNAFECGARYSGHSVASYSEEVERTTSGNYGDSTYIRSGDECSRETHVASEEKSELRTSLLRHDWSRFFKGSMVCFLPSPRKGKSIQFYFYGGVCSTPSFPRQCV